VRSVCRLCAVGERGGGKLVLTFERLDKDGKASELDSTPQRPVAFCAEQSCCCLLVLSPRSPSRESDFGMRATWAIIRALGPNPEAAAAELRLVTETSCVS
jgi:hypothetical protein